MRAGKRVAVFDCETPPFELDRQDYRPFAVGFYDGMSYRRFWGYNAPSNFICFLRDYPEPLILYAHNGGKFDFLFFMPWLSRRLLIINGRITKAHIFHHELRDSYSIIPEKLADFKGKHQKTAIDYDMFTERNRERFKHEICAYLRDDVLTLYEGVQYFRADFGNALTIGMAALTEFQKHHSFEHISASDDAFFRRFYFGGRCQCFKVGVFNASPDLFKVYDVNSMYAYVMKEYHHPISAEYTTATRITKRTTFAMVEGESFGALPVRTIENGIKALSFTQARGTYYAGIHELQLAIDLKLFKLHKVHFAVEHKRTASFGTFVDWVTERKIAMEKAGETARRNNYKRVGNSCYGKFAQDPENYKDHIIKDQVDIPGEDWTPCMVADGYVIWERPSLRRNYNNVAIGASITSASRAVLLRGLASSHEPFYCDTDSIICKRFEGNVHPTKLGAWKLEGEGDRLAIAGKKSYVLSSNRSDVVKMASKGVPRDTTGIVRIITNLAKNSRVKYNVTNPVPHFTLDGCAHYISRTLRQTGVATEDSRTPSQALLRRKQAR